jgi:hypothetical protein
MEPGSQSAYRRATSWTTGIRYLAEERDFSLLNIVQTGIRKHPASYSMGIMGFFPGSKEVEA